MDEPDLILGPAAAFALVALPLAVLRRSRRLLLLGGSAVALELAPRYRAWLARWRAAQG